MACRQLDRTSNTCNDDRMQKKRHRAHPLPLQLMPATARTTLPSRTSTPLAHLAPATWSVDASCLDAARRTSSVVVVVVAVGSNGSNGYPCSLQLASASMNELTWTCMLPNSSSFS